jgi:hypothetical protein
MCCTALDMGMHTTDIITKRSCPLLQASQHFELWQLLKVAAEANIQACQGWWQLCVLCAAAALAMPANMLATMHCLATHMPSSAIPRT